jgi:hypothetical protein
MTRRPKRRARPPKAPPLPGVARMPVAVPTGDLPTPFAMQHASYGLEQVAAKDREIVTVARVLRNREVLPVDSCLARGNITARQHEAGVRVYTLHIQSGFADRGRDSTTLIGAISGESTGGKVAVAIHATRELTKLREHLAARARGRYRNECYAIGMSVCAHREGTGQRKPEYRRWQLLLAFLTATADFWGLPPEGAQ